MIPVIAIVGRPNVGKSTLFNCITLSRDALVLDIPGVTRDRQYGECAVGDVPAIVIDTGGMVDSPDGVETLMNKQVKQALIECDEILFLVDAKSGLTGQDEQCAQLLRQQHKKVHLVVNKIDAADPDIALAEFYSLGFGEPIDVSAAHRRGIYHLVEQLLEPYKAAETVEAEESGIKIAVVGKPNVGKSTLINRILGEERVVVFDEPGTTRDSIYIPFERRDVKYTFIDTAGVRRRARIDKALEKFSVVKSLKAIEDAHVVLMLIDATENITEQDLKLLSFIVEAGRSLVLVVNKWDGLDSEVKTRVQTELKRRLPFLDYVKFHYISALHGTGVGELYSLIDQTYLSATKELSTPELTRILENSIAKFQPPLVKGRRVKCRYAHAGGHCPPVIVIHGNQVSRLPSNYQRYLQKCFREALKMVGTPVKLQFKDGDNPYKDKKNVLTDRQVKKKKRLMRHVKK